jgi:hypothetical protein
MATVRPWRGMALAASTAVTVLVLCSAVEAQRMAERAEQIREYLMSRSPELQARGARLAVLGNHRSAVPAVESALYRSIGSHPHVKYSPCRAMDMKSTSDAYFAQAALLDALILLDARVKRPEVLVGLDEFDEQVLRLLVVLEKERRRPLFLAFMRKPSRPRLAWIACYNLLIEKMEKDFAEYLWASLRLCVEVCVVEGGRSPPEEAAGPTGTRPRSMWWVPSGFPPVASYYLETRWDWGGQLIARGDPSIYMKRVECGGGKGIQYCRSLEWPNINDLRIRALEKAAEGSFAGNAVARNRSVVTFEDGAERYKALLRDRVSAVAGMIESAKRRLLANGVVDGTSAGPRIELYINDLRKDKSRALPKVDALPMQAAEISYREWLIGWAL